MPLGRQKEVARVPEVAASEGSGDLEAVWQAGLWKGANADSSNKRGAALPELRTIIGALRSGAEAA
jgi:hypothetical protein